MSLVVASSLLIVLFHNCSPSPIVQRQLPAIGEPVDLKPASQNVASKEHHQFAHLLIYFSKGSQSLDFSDNGTIRMFASPDQSEPMYQFRVSELSQTYEQTRCPRTISETLQNAYVGDVLFCNHNLDLSKVSYFTYEAPGERLRTATAYLVEYIKPEKDLIAISISFH